jgi:predicted PurR-regulated permease PerM
VKLGQWLGLVALILSLYILWQTRQLLLLVFTAVIFATALNRVVRRFQKWGLKRSHAVVATFAACILLNILFFFLIVPPFIEQFQKLIELVPSVFQRIRDQLILLAQSLPKPLASPANLQELISQLQPLGNVVLRQAVAFFSNSLTSVLQFLLVLIFTLMFLANPVEYRKSFIHLFPSFYRRRADAVLSECEVALGNWLGGIVINSIFIAFLSGFGLAVLGIQLVLVHALLAGILNFIPNVGPTISMVFPMMIALLDAPWKIVAVLIWYIIVQQVESYWLTPTVMAKQVSLLPAVTLIAQIFFASTFGVLGLFLALPLTVVAKTWIDEVLFKDILDRWGDRPEANVQYLPSSTPPVLLDNVSTDGEEDSIVNF